MADMRFSARTDTHLVHIHTSDQCSLVLTLLFTSPSNTVGGSCVTYLMMDQSAVAKKKGNVQRWLGPAWLMLNFNSPEYCAREDR